MRLTELHETLVALRGDLAAELEAISRLEGQSSDVSDDEVREELRRMAEEKKGHAATLVRLIAKLDPKFRERL